MNLQEQTNRIKSIMGIINEASKKDVLINKLGFNEENAAHIERICGPFSVWLGNKYIQGVFDNLRTFTKELSDEELKKVVLEKINRNSGYDILNTGPKFVSIMDYIRIGLNGNNSTIKNLKFEELYNKSEEWHESLEIKGGDVNYKETNPIIIDFNDGYYWADLQTNNSPQECDRMGHCGKTAQGNTIFSLRKNIQLPGGKHTLNKSLLTASINKRNGTLYQLKGPKNSKPSEDYFKYILPLLYLKDSDGDYVIMSFGREYGHERDFKISDLPKDDILNLINDRPDLFDSEDILDDVLEKNPEILPEIYQVNPQLFNPPNNNIIDTKGEQFPGLVKQIYQDYPEWFESIKLQYLLFKLKLIDEDPLQWIFKIHIAPDEIEDYVKGGWSTGKRKTNYGTTINISVFESILNNDTWDLYQSYETDWKSSLNYYVDEENKNKIKTYLEEIRRNRGDDIDDVESDDMDIEELIDEYDDDSEISGAISRATETAEADDYHTHLTEALKEALNEYGEIIEMDESGVTLNINLKDKYDYLENHRDYKKYFWEYMDNCNYEADCVFNELVTQGELEKPKFDIDDRWSPDINEEYFNLYLNDYLNEII